ncbi:MAG: hypothetical protein ACMG6E_08960, partial [Candidatus Roizmanbacteria bacterium]
DWQGDRLMMGMHPTPSVEYIFKGISRWQKVNAYHNDIPKIINDNDIVISCKPELQVPRTCVLLLVMRKYHEGCHSLPLDIFKILLKMVQAMDDIQYKSVQHPQLKSAVIRLGVIELGFQKSYAWINPDGDGEEMQLQVSCTGKNLRTISCHLEVRDPGGYWLGLKPGKKYLQTRITGQVIMTETVTVSKNLVNFSHDFSMLSSLSNEFITIWIHFNT